MRGSHGRQVSSAVSVVTVPVGGTVAVAVVFAVIVAGALAMTVKLGEVLTEGSAVMCVGHVELHS
jgi:hypothetical protein